MYPGRPRLRPALAEEIRVGFGLAKKPKPPPYPEPEPEQFPPDPQAKRAPAVNKPKKRTGRERTTGSARTTHGKAAASGTALSTGKPVTKSGGTKRPAALKDTPSAPRAARTPRAAADRPQATPRTSKEPVSTSEVATTIKPSAVRKGRPAQATVVIPAPADPYSLADGFREDLREDEQPVLIPLRLLAVGVLLLSLVGGLSVYLAADALFGSESNDRATQSGSVPVEPTAAPTAALPAAVAPAPTAEPLPGPVPEPRPEPATELGEGPVVAPLPLPPVSPGSIAYVDTSGVLHAVSEGGADAVVANGAQHPAWSADGARVAYVTQANGGNEIWVWDAANGATKIVGPFTELVRGVAWEPSGSGLLYHEQSGGNETGRIMRVGLDGSVSEVLSPSALSMGADGRDAIIHGFDVAPDGRLVFQASVARRGAAYADACGILVTNIGGGASEVMPVQQGACYGLPSVSPDGAKAAFISYPGDGAGYLAVVNLDGSGYEQLSRVHLRSIADHPFWPKIAWSADSSRVYFESVEGGDVIFSQEVQDTSGNTRTVWSYGRHPAGAE